MTELDSGIKRRSVERAVSSARRRAETRAQSIIDAAAELVLERNDTNFTMMDLLARAHISQRSFSVYFETRQELLCALCDSILHREVLAIRQFLAGDSDPLIRLERATNRLFDLYQVNTGSGAQLNTIVLQLFLSEPADFESLCQPLIALFENLTKDLAAQGRLNPAITPRTAAILTMQVVMNTSCFSAQNGRGADTVAEIKRDVWNLCVDGIGEDDHRLAIPSVT